MSTKTWISFSLMAAIVGGSGVLAQLYDVQDQPDKDPNAPLSHCNPCTGGFEGVLEPCDDWQLVSGVTGPGGTGDVDAAYQFDAVASTTYIFSFCDDGGTANFDTGISVWDPTCAGSLLACSDDFCGLLSRVEWTAPSSGPFVVRVGGFGGSTGSFTLAYRAVGLACGGISVTPAGGFNSSGLIGGPFDPPSKTYTITNEDEFAIDFEVSKTQDWVSLDDGSGPSDGPIGDSLAPGEEMDIEVVIDDDANTLPLGVFSDTVTFENLTDGNGNATRSVTLVVNDPLAPQLVINGDFETGDLNGWTVVNTGSGDLVINDGTLNPASPDGPLPPCNGNFSAMTNPTGPGVSVLSQDLNLLPGFDIVTLSWTDRIRNHAGDFIDPIQEFRVEIRDTNDVVLREVFSTEPGDPPLTDCTQRTFDVSEFAEQTIRLAFSEEDSLFFFNLHLDDIAVTLGKTNQPPLASAGNDQTEECAGSDGAQVTLDGSGSTDPDSTAGTNDDIVLFEWFEDFGLPSEVLLGTGETLVTTLALGSHAITLRVTDSAGDQDTDTLTASVVDTTPPTLSISLTPMVLWPPNHQMATISAVVTADDACGGPVVSLTSVTSDEPDNASGAGDGNTTNDIQGVDIGTPDAEFELRAERAGTGDGRTYTAVYSASDGSGNVGSDSGLVFVPHDQGGATDPVSVTVANKPDGFALEWNDVAGAFYYNVIRGDLANLHETQNAIDLGVVTCVQGQAVEAGASGLDSDASPEPGQVFFYLVEYFDGWNHSSYGTESVPKPRMPNAGDCE